MKIPENSNGRNENKLTVWLNLDNPEDVAMFRNGRIKELVSDCLKKHFSDFNPDKECAILYCMFDLATRNVLESECDLNLQKWSFKFKLKRRFGMWFSDEGEENNETNPQGLYSYDYDRVTCGFNLTCLDADDIVGKIQKGIQKLVDYGKNGFVGKRKRLDKILWKTQYAIEKSDKDLRDLESFKEQYALK